MPPTQVKPTVSFIIPALNESANIACVVQGVLDVVQKLLPQFEIILVDDGSTDGTGSIMDEMASANSNIRVLHNDRNLGLGGAYKRGLAAARFDHVMGIWGDNSMPADGLARIIAQIGTADSVISYVVNFWEIKSVPRYIGSRVYTGILNLLFGLHVNYYNGYAVHRADLLRSIDITSDGFGFQAEIVLKLLGAGHSYMEVGVESKAETTASSALRLKNLLRVGRVLLHLIWKVPKFRKNSRPNYKAIQPKAITDERPR